MKKIIAILAALTMSLGMTACGGKSQPAAAPASSAPASSTVAPKPAPAPSAPAASSSAAAPVADAKYSDAQNLVIEDYNKIIDRFNAAADTINADQGLVSLDLMVDTCNQISEILAQITTELDKGEVLDDNAIGSLGEFVHQCDMFLDELETMIKSYAGQETFVIATTLINNSGSTLHTLAMSPASDALWGANLLATPLDNGGSEPVFLIVTKENLNWDLLTYTADGTELQFNGLDFTGVDAAAGATVTLTMENGEYFAAVDGPAQG